MKKIRFTINQLIVIGLLFFACTTVIHFWVSDVMKVLALFIMSLFVMGLLFYQQIIPEESDFRDIEQINATAEMSLKQLLDNMPVGVVKFTPDDLDLEWYNPYAELVFSNESGSFDSEGVQAILSQYQSSPMSTYDIQDKRYSISVDPQTGIFYFYNNISKEHASDSALETSPVIGVVSVDNYDDATESLADADISRLNGFIANFMSTFTQEYGIFYRRVDMDRFYLFTDYTVLSQLMSSKFSILDEFRKKAQEVGLPLTLSMGISFGKENHAEIGQIAHKNLNMALVRGGDQVVLKENDERKEFLYFGGASVSTVKRSRTRTRAMMTAISDKIKTADRVFVMGHRNLDMDALGATVGMEFFASQLINDTYAVIDDEQMATDIERAVVDLKEDTQTRFITVKDALSKITKRSLLIMVDHSKPSLTLSTELYQQFSEVIVVDHHRRDDDFPDNAVLTFIESGASSASELVTELIQFQSVNKKLSKIQASILMAGIMLDTKNFTSRVTSRTFDVGSYLRTLGSDNVAIRQIVATDFDEYRDVNELILNAERPWPQVIIASGQSDKAYSNVIASKAADTILEMSGVEASFVVTKHVDGYVAVSSRSHSKINVQRIMEQLGGGGHFNLAACQLTDKSISETIASLKEMIQEEIKDNEEN